MSSLVSTLEIIKTYNNFLMYILYDDCISDAQRIKQAKIAVEDIERTFYELGDFQKGETEC